MNRKLAFLFAVLFTLGLAPLAQAANGTPNMAQVTAPAASGAGQKAAAVRQHKRAVHKARTSHRKTVARKKAPVSAKLPPR